MKKLGDSMKRIFGIIIVACLNQAQADVRDTRVIYGEDNRKETYDATPIQRLLAESTAAMIPNKNMLDVDGEHSLLPPQSFKNTYSLCEEERFKDQPTSASCSGFLISPDILVTAGHCITSQKGCEEVSWVFDYKVKKENNRADVLIPNENIYKCQKVIETMLDGRGEESRDFAVIKLDRPVKKARALLYRTRGKINQGSGIYVIGHPTGLPQKVTDGGKVFENTSKRYFVSNLDTYGGNSGSAVFNALTNQVEGILVRGAKDFVEDSCGLRSNKVDENMVSEVNEPLGESVSRITDIPALMARKSLFMAVKKGDLALLKKLSKNGNYLHLTDNTGNTLLHEAARNYKVDVLRYLLTKDININAQNQNFETPLHIAAYVNSKKSVKLLLKNGANLLIKDKFGVYPSGRTMLFSFGLRKMLRRLEKKSQNN